MLKNWKKYSKGDKRNFVRILIFLVIIVALVFTLYFGLRHIVITLKYKPYTDKMYDLGYNELYQNKEATSTQSVSNIDLIKVVACSLKNVKDIDSLYYFENNKLAEDEKWITYANDFGLLNINTNNLNKKVTKAQAALTISKVIDKILGKDIPSAKTDVSQSKLSKYTADDRLYLNQAVTLGLLKNLNSDLKDYNITKGELNKFVVELLEKYAIIYYKSYEENDIKIVTDEKKLPDNASSYPYVIDSIPKEIYEKEFKIVSKDTALKPKEVYKLMGGLFSQIDEKESNYFESILNVVYKKITVENFKNSINSYVVYALNDEDVKEYVEYVKKNKITLKGKAEPLLPIIYYNGEQFVLRTKISFDVENSDTEYNLLFGDEKNKIRYVGKNIVMYVDVPMSMTVNSYTMLVRVSCLANNIIKTSNSIVVEK